MASDPQTDQTLKGIYILEKDTNGDVMITWSHLTFDATEYESFDNIVKSRSLINSTRTQSFSKYKDKWIYIVTQDGPEKNTRVQYFSLCLFVSEFNPEKYGALATHMANLYRKTNSPVKVLECFLDVMTTLKHEGTDNGENLGIYNGVDYNNKDHFLVSPLLEIVTKFEGNSWLIWSALIMKKRIIVYADALPTLLKFVRALPLFVLHRQDWSLLRPFVTLENEAEITDLVKTGVYVAGFLYPQVKAREDLYDIFLDITTLDISVASHAEDDFVQTQFHQEFAKFLASALELEGITDQKLIKAIKTKTGDLITKLNQLKVQGNGDEKPYVSYSSFTNQNIPGNMENFLYAVASAEGMTKISTQ